MTSGEFYRVWFGGSSYRLYDITSLVFEEGEAISLNLTPHLAETRGKSLPLTMLGFFHPISVCPSRDDDPP